VASIIHPQAAEFEAAGIAAHRAATLDDSDIEDAAARQTICDAEAGRAGAKNCYMRARHCVLEPIEVA
jgi:hypothetical protein